MKGYQLPDLRLGYSHPVPELTDVQWRQWLELCDLCSDGRGMPRRPKRGADIVIPGRRDYVGHSHVDLASSGTVTRFFDHAYGGDGGGLPAVTIHIRKNKKKLVIVAPSSTGSTLEVTPTTYGMFVTARKKLWPGFKFAVASHDQTVSHVPMFGADRFPKMLTTCPFEDQDRSGFIQHIIRR
jgi:hypothetical protein